MKCNIHKMNEFFKTQNDDIKKFIIKLLEKFIQSEYNENYIVFLQLGFFEIEDGDEIDDELFVIDFITLSSLEETLKKFILKILEEEYDISNTITQSVLIPYKDWEKVNRKNKLLNINNI